VMSVFNTSNLIQIIGDSYIIMKEERFFEIFSK
jgi:hypothetical protein